MRTLPHARSQVNMIETRKREHSRKPDEQYSFIEACSPGPYLELFARHPQPGWTVWGDEAAEDVTPRGRAHKGYAGGAIEVPRITKHVRLDPATADRVGKELRIRYEAGESIRQIGADTGYGITRVRGLLKRAGTTLRERGAR
jgi:hypothetical protein